MKRGRSRGSFINPMSHDRSRASKSLQILFFIQQRKIKQRKIKNSKNFTDSMFQLRAGGVIPHIGARNKVGYRMQAYNAAFPPHM